MHAKRVEVEGRRSAEGEPTGWGGGVVEEEEGIFAFHCKGLGVKNNYNNKKTQKNSKYFY